jgi:hypothetical protein
LSEFQSYAIDDIIAEKIRDAYKEKGKGFALNEFYSWKRSLKTVVLNSKVMVNYERV